MALPSGINGSLSILGPVPSIIHSLSKSTFTFPSSSLGTSVTNSFPLCNVSNRSNTLESEKIMYMCMFLQQIKIL